MAVLREGCSWHRSSVGILKAGLRSGCVGCLACPTLDPRPSLPPAAPAGRSLVYPIDLSLMSSTLYQWCFCPELLLTGNESVCGRREGRLARAAAGGLFRIFRFSHNVTNLWNLPLSLSAAQRKVRHEQHCCVCRSPLLNRRDCRSEPNTVRDGRQVPMMHRCAVSVLCRLLCLLLSVGAAPHDFRVLVWSASSSPSHPLWASSPRVSHT